MPYYGWKHDSKCIVRGSLNVCGWFCLSFKLDIPCYVNETNNQHIYNNKIIKCRCISSYIKIDLIRARNIISYYWYQKEVAQTGTYISHIPLYADTSCTKGFLHPCSLTEGYCTLMKYAVIGQWGMQGI